VVRSIAKPAYNQDLLKDAVSGVWRCVGLVKIDMSMEHFASIFRVEIISELGTTAVTDCNSDSITIKITSYCLKNAVFWDVTPGDSCKNRRFGRTYLLHHQSDMNLRARNNVSSN
jgi:hypothetical protein